MNPDKGIYLWSDGSSDHRSRQGGWAFVVQDYYGNEHESAGSAEDTTNNRMEMEACRQGLEWVYNSFGPCIILLCSDSQILGYGLTKVWKAKANLDLWEKLWEIADKHQDIDFHWIRGHSGNELNEKCDKLASEARKQLIVQKA